MNGKSPLVLMMMSVACLLGEAYELSGSWKIVLAENPSETEVYAAEEFRTYAEKISAFRLEIEKTGKVPDGNAVVIGSPETFPALRSAASRFKIESGRGDRLAVHTENGNLFLAGGSPRGAHTPRSAARRCRYVCMGGERVRPVYLQRRLLAGS